MISDVNIVKVSIVQLKTEGGLWDYNEQASKDRGKREVMQAMPRVCGAVPAAGV